MENWSDKKQEENEFIKNDVRSLSSGGIYNSKILELKKIRMRYTSKRQYTNIIKHKGQHKV